MIKFWRFNRKKKETVYVYEIDPNKAETFNQLKALTILSLNTHNLTIQHPIRVTKNFLIDYPEANALVTKKVDVNNE